MPSISYTRLKNSKFIGRKVEIQKIYETVLTPDNKLTIVMGAQRVGKTETVNQMVHYASERGHFAGGILWIEIEQAKEPNLIEKFVEKVREIV